MSYGNVLVERLGRIVGPSIVDLLEPVQLRLMDRLDDDGALTHVFFPISAVVSLLFRDGERSLETLTVGREGLIGLPAVFGRSRFLPHTFAQCQIAGSGWRIEVDEFATLLDAADGRAVLERYSLERYARLERQMYCNAYHPIEQRVARWLLVTADQAASDRFTITQEFLSEMLGVRRASVNEVQQRLSGLGLIDYGRGQMQIVDRPGLEGQACACYGATLDIATEVWA